MLLKNSLWALLALGLAAAVWIYHDPHQLGRLLPHDGATSARKCQTATGVIYTDGACPASSREMPITGGAVTVVPGQRAVSVPSPVAAASAPSLVRDLAGAQDGNDIKNKLIDQAMSR